MGFLFQIHHVVTVIEENKVFVDNRSTAEKTLNLTGLIFGYLSFVKPKVLTKLGPKNPKVA